MRNLRIISALSLFGSASTLICCALPALLVTIGAGASLVGLLGAFPQLIWFSENKILVFAIAGALLVLTGVAQWQAKKQACPIDPKLREACQDSKSWSGPLYFISVAIFSIGAFFAFLAPIIF